MLKYFYWTILMLICHGSVYPLPIGVFLGHVVSCSALFCPNLSVVFGLGVFLHGQRERLHRVYPT